MQAFVDSWMFAGIVLITTVTTGLGRSRGARRRRPVRAVPRLPRRAAATRAARARLPAVGRGRRGRRSRLLVLVVSILYLGIVRGTWLAPARHRAQSSGSSCSRASRSPRSRRSSCRSSAPTAPSPGWRRSSARCSASSPPRTSRSACSPTPSRPSSPRCRSRRRACCCVASSRMGRCPTITADAPGAAEPLRAFYGIDLAIVGDWAVPAGSSSSCSWRMAVVCTALSARPHPSPHPVSAPAALRSQPRLVEWHAS